MGLNIKNAEVEQLAKEVARMAVESKTEAIRKALLERRARLQAIGRRSSGRASIREYLEREVWPSLPPSVLGKVLSREEEDEILGFGPNGV